jgi:type VI secretion system protein ImpJ
MLADDIPSAIQWHEGMLLAPQHFQQNSWRHEMLVQHATLLASPFSWGIRRLSLDLKLLPAGTLRVLDLEAVLPDGAVVSHQPQGREELMIDLTSRAEDLKQRDVTVHLAVPAHAQSLSAGMERFEAFEGAPVADANTGEGELRMPMLRPRLSLIATDSPPPKYVSFPLARLRFQDEAYVLTDYVPPVIAVAPRTSLWEMCSALAARLREKAIFISEQTRSPSASQDIQMLLENRSRMHCLVGDLPALEALLAVGTTHPFTLYITLCSVAGHLAGLGDSLMPPMLTPYDHYDLRSTFQEVLNFAFRMTSEGVPESFDVHPFRLREGIFGISFNPEWMGKHLVLGMRLATGVSERDAITWGDEALIGSESVISGLRDRRVRGASRQFVESDQELVPVRGVILFSLRADPEFVRPGEILQILNLGQRGRAALPLEILLYVKNGAG